MCEISSNIILILKTYEYFSEIDIIQLIQVSAFCVDVILNYWNATYIFLNVPGFLNSIVLLD